MAADSPIHLTLEADTVATATFQQDYRRIEVTNVTGTAAVYFRIGQAEPAVETTGSHVLPPAISSVEVDVHTSGPTVVKLISAGTPKVSVRAL